MNILSRKVKELLDLLVVENLLFVLQDRNQLHILEKFGKNTQKIRTVSAAGLGPGTSPPLKSQQR